MQRRILNKYRKTVLLYFCLLLPQLFFAQNAIRGFVVDSASQRPIEGAAVFFNNTSYGTVTNTNGFFVLPVFKETKSPLIIKYLGYETLSQVDPPQNQNVRFVLRKTATQLDAVVINSHSSIIDEKEMSAAKRTQFMTIFRFVFYGEREHHKKINLANDEDLHFQYNPETLQLVVECNEPLLITNNYLAYQITYYLDTFVVNFSQDTPLKPTSIKTYSVAGTLLFSDLQDPDDPRNKYKRRRNKAYYGSVLHFMRSLAKNKLEEEQFLIKNLAENATHDSIFEYRSHSDFTEIIPAHQVWIFNKKYTHHSSTLISHQNFGVDRLGNFFPWDAITFHGKMGREGMATQLPLNFEPYQ